MFAGRIEDDEARFGGKRKFEPKSKKAELSGRDPLGIAVIVGANEGRAILGRAAVAKNASGRSTYGTSLKTTPITMQSCVRAR